MNTYFNPEVGDMDLHKVRAKMDSLCAEINAANGFVDTFNDNFIADLRRRSKALGEEITVEFDRTSGSHVVKSWMTSDDALMARISRAFPPQSTAPDLTTDALRCLCETLNMPKDSSLLDVLVAANARLRSLIHADDR